MRKLYVILIMLLLPYCSVAQNDCSSNYGSALADFKAGKYAEAQKKFITIANVCGDYSEVYKKLRECNSQMVQAQNKLQTESKQLREEIDRLKAQNKKLNDEKNSAIKAKDAAEEKYQKELSGRAQDVSNFRREKGELEAQKEQLETETARLQALVSRLQDSLNQAMTKVSELEAAQLKENQVKKLNDYSQLAQKCDNCIDTLTAYNFAKEVDALITDLIKLQNSENSLSKENVSFNMECNSKVEKFYEKLTELKSLKELDANIEGYIQRLLESQSPSPSNILKFKAYSKSLKNEGDK